MCVLCHISPPPLKKLSLFINLKMFYWTGRVILEVLPPISTTGLTTEDVTSLTDMTREKMLDCFNRISEEAKTF